MQRHVRMYFVLALTLFIAGCGFAGVGYSTYDPPGFFMGIWHGLLAPWSLISRLFFDIKMYAVPNSGWFYDFGFLIGIVFSIPVGPIAVAIATGIHIFA